jgi:hypothetical protein
MDHASDAFWAVWKYWRSAGPSSGLKLFVGNELQDDRQFFMGALE